MHYQTSARHDQNLDFDIWEQTPATARHEFADGRLGLKEFQVQSIRQHWERSAKIPVGDQGSNKVGWRFDGPDILPFNQVSSFDQWDEACTGKDAKRIDKILGDIINEYKVKRKTTTTSSDISDEEDLADVLLKLQDSDELHFLITTNNMLSFWYVLADINNILTEIKKSQHLSVKRMKWGKKTFMEQTHNTS
ncbi:hypothetical protein F0562_011281 [Nyssa sinensis]|uniref:Uncharacterized protein n=1 Tax=Nyssa sinensis TaxID=561372 RepID=A0A5J5A4I2_9ASTE|nr:hypothetical protein F0562_011281 [Nyssa sinensis]